VQGYTPRKNQSSHGGWDSVNGPVSPQRDILRDWTRTGNKAVPIFQQVLNEDSLLLILVWVQIAVAVYVILGVIVRSDTWLLDISYFVRGHRNWKAYTAGGRKE